jgi:hypothetical protein
MKKLCFTTMIVILLLLHATGIQAQTKEQRLNQIELMKQLLGTWKTEFSNGNSMILDFTPFGNAIVGKVKSTANGVTKDIILEIWGYDERNDKIIVAEVFNNTPVMEIDILWFSSKNVIEGVMQKDISNPENADIKYKIEIKSPDTLLMITKENNTTPSIITWNREKK